MSDPGIAFTAARCGKRRDEHLRLRDPKTRQEVEIIRTRVVTYLRNGVPWWLTFPKHPGMEATNSRGERGPR